MKNFILSVLALFVMSTGFAQSENEPQTLTFDCIGYNGLVLTATGNNTVTITNTKPCGGDVEVELDVWKKKNGVFQWVKTDWSYPDFYIKKASQSPNFKVITLPTTYGLTVRLRAKWENYDCGYIPCWSVVETSLPLKFTSFNIERINDTECFVNFEVAEVVNVKEININVSIDGKTYKVFATLKPNQTVYRERLNLATFVKTGLTPLEQKQ
jgi:hypothetical protein